MCGRYALGLTHEEILERFGFDELDERRPPVLPLPRFNVAPSQSIPVMVETDQERELRMMRWGFKPAWMKHGGKRPPPINAPAEKLLERPLFRGAVTGGRCIVPASGFFEWAGVPGRTRLGGVDRGRPPACRRFSWPHHPPTRPAPVQHHGGRDRLKGAI